MAEHARLVAPHPEQTNWPHHKLQWGTVRASSLFSGDRRMEAETYLSSGFELRASIEGGAGAWQPLGDVADVWQPSRLKGILVSKGIGTPFLAATQVFDARPVPRKWLAVERTTEAESRYVMPGQILVTRSGSVGRTTVAYSAHEHTLISDDLLRVDARDECLKGWIYAYLLTPQSRAVMTGEQYGHIIKHLETTHLLGLPVPHVDDATAAKMNNHLNRVLQLRNDGHILAIEAEKHFERALGTVDISDWGEQGFIVRASRALFTGRHRLEASVFNPGIQTIRAHLAVNGKGFTTLRESSFDVWVPGRYKRIPSDSGVVYRDSADILEVSPDLTKRFVDTGFGDNYGGRVEAGWILIPSSGQVYGIIGTAVLASDALHGQVVSNHVIRIAPRADAAIRAGYLVTALSHPMLGRPLVKALAFGSSVPEIAPDDIADLEVVRLEDRDEGIIADLAEAAAKARAESDILERQMAAEAEAIITSFTAPPSLHLV